MNHSKTYRREDGSRVRIEASVFEFSKQWPLTVVIKKCDKGKRTFYTPNYREFDYRCAKNKHKYMRDLVKELATPEEIAEVKAELAEKVKQAIIDKVEKFDK